MFTRDSKIKDIVGCKEFEGYRHVVGAFPGIGGIFSGALKLSTMCKMVGTWDADDIVDGMNYLRKSARKRKVFYNIYSDQEIRSDPSLNMTGLAALTIEDKKKVPFVVVCAGGGYGSVCSMVEAYPVIKALNEMGYAAFSVQYRVGKNAHFPNPIDDLARAVTFIREHADEFNVDVSDYAVMGFSAGGHLVGSFGTSSIGYKKYGLPKPKCLMLCYPVITLIEEETHKGTVKNFIGKNWKSREEQEKYSIQRLVDKDYPPSFIWQFDNDNMVPSVNSKYISKALNDAGIQNEYITYPGTVHGAGMGNQYACKGWLDKAVTFWNNIETS